MIVGELEHSRLKKWYLRTNKTNAPAHVAIREQCERTLRAIDQNVAEFFTLHHYEHVSVSCMDRINSSRDRPGNSLADHHWISKRKYTTYEISQLLEDNEADLAYKVGIDIFMRYYTKWKAELFTSTQGSPLDAVARPS